MNNLNEKQESRQLTRFRALGWLTQRLTGIGLLLFLGFHFWLQHMPNGFLATAEEYNELLKVLGAGRPEFRDAVTNGVLKEALPEEYVITYSKVIERLQAPLWKIVDIILLLLALSHGMQGLGRVIGDFTRRVFLRKALVTLGWAGAAVLAWQGIVTVMSVGT